MIFPHALQVVLLGIRMDYTPPHVGLAFIRVSRHPTRMGARLQRTRIQVVLQDMQAFGKYMCASYWLKVQLPGVQFPQFNIPFC